MAEDHNAVPVRIGHYDILRTIGKGNFAVVKLARHTPTNLKVAIKVISTRSLDAEQLRKLTREIDIMKRVGPHPNIVRLYQVMQSERHMMLVTEYCAGGEVFDQLVNNGRMSETRARDYFHQIIGAVNFLHSRGIVHRDLKAENLLLSADLGRIKLADFGFSNYFTRDAFLSTWCGSPPYAAPELFEGKQYSGPKADIWSLGVVLYVLVCGALPFDGNTLQSLKQRVLTGKFRIPYFMSCDCEHLIRHMLVTDPERRYGLSQVISHRWMSVPPSVQLGAQDDSNDSISVSLQKCTLDSNNNDDDCETAVDMSIVDWISAEMKFDSDDVINAVKNRSFDALYALYHLVRDHSSHLSLPNISAPPSPPLLPIVPSCATQRKSSITTGIVERGEPSPPATTPTAAQLANLQAISALRRHTFGPEGSVSVDGSNPQSLITPPMLFLTPPLLSGVPTAAPMANLPFAPPNYPLTNMDLLRPPPVLMMVNNMGRRASDTQANYTRALMEAAMGYGTGGPSTSNQVAPGSPGPCPSPSPYSYCAKPPTHQASPPLSYFKRKRHSLTDTNELVARQRRSTPVANLPISPSPLEGFYRSRRRASDGCGLLMPTQILQQNISLSTLQNELRALCVSSPPSIHTSPIHCAGTPSGTTSVTGNCTIGPSGVPSGSSSCPLPNPSSPPPPQPPAALPLIEEHPQSGPGPEDEEMTGGGGNGVSCLDTQMTTAQHPMSAVPVRPYIPSMYSPVQLITPPNSFRSSPVTSPSQAPQIAVTDELGAMQYPILPPPMDFQLVASHSCLENAPERTITSVDMLLNKLHRWRNDENICVPQLPSQSSDGSDYSGASHPNLSQHAGYMLAQAVPPRPDVRISSFVQQETHYSSLQQIHKLQQEERRLTTTDSGSICIRDLEAATKFLDKFGSFYSCNSNRILSFDNTQIGLEWNALQQQLILRHISGERSNYKNICQQLISTII